MTTNRSWLAFANENICNHRKALKELGFINWTIHTKSKFAENDIVYLFMNDDRAVRFKLRVDMINIPREDGDYWIKTAPKDYTYRLKFVEEYNGNLLNEDILKNLGFKGGSSILNPIYNNMDLMEYIEDVFKIAAQTTTLPSHYMVVDLGTGSYWENHTGHEVFNLEPNDVDGRFYGYLPPEDNPNIENLGACKTDEYIDNIMVVYVKKVPNSNNRQIIAFTDNAKVYKNKQLKSSLNRVIFDSGKRTECTYTIESDYIYDLRNYPNPFVFNVSEHDSGMFRAQRFYTGRRPKQEAKMLLWLIDYLQNKEQEENNDLDFQERIQESEIDLAISDTSKQQPNYSNGSTGKIVMKKASIAKQALKKANFKCTFDHNHKTFLTNKGFPYMEGHHLIPCTISNTAGWTFCMVRPVIIG